MQELEYSPPTHEFKTVPSSIGCDRPEVHPDDQAGEDFFGLRDGALLQMSGRRSVRSEGA